MRQQPPQAAPRHASPHSSEHFGGQVLHHMLALATQSWRLPAPPGRPWALFTKLQLIVTLGCGGLSVFVGHADIFIDRRRYATENKEQPNKT